MELPETARDIDSPAGRRLWLLRTLLERMEPEAALALAERMENFIVDAAAAAGDARRCRRPADEDAGPATGRVRGTTTASSTAAVSPCGGRLLGDAQLSEFIETATLGASNQDLGRRFGLTPRQANSIRMGLAKRAPQVALKRGADRPKENPDRATELQMQSAFLRERPPRAPTLDDVVRFLRQRGDAVTRSGSDFMINNRLVLTPQELVRRANEKKAQLGQNPFPSELWSPPPECGVVGREGHAGTPPVPERGTSAPAVVRRTAPFFSRGKMFSS
jgi:hypothetical protein